MAARLLTEGKRLPFSKSLIVLSLKFEPAASFVCDQSSRPRAALDWAGVIAVNEYRPNSTQIVDKRSVNG